MINMPSALMAPDGNLSFSASGMLNIQHYNLGFQPLPWLEVGFRYSGLEDFDPAFPVYYDRSFALKARLLNETAWLPAVAVGLEDVVGTGIYSGEYLVASKRIGKLDTSLGIGWGRRATANTFRNPLTLISKSLETRVNNQTGVGQFSFSEYFHGPKVGLFGGVVWHTPWERLDLIAEYSSDTYAFETSRGTFTPANQINLGANYRIFDATTLGVYWLYGRSVGVSLSFDVDPTRNIYAVRLGPELTPLHARTDDQQRRALQGMTGGGAPQSADLADALWRDIIAVRDISLQGTTLTVQVTSGTAATICNVAANLAASHGTDIETVVVRSPFVQTSCKAPSGFARAHMTNFVTLPPKRTPQAVPLSGPITIDAADPAQITPTATRAAMIAQARQQGLTILAMDLSGSLVTVYYSNAQYSHEREAVDRLVRILSEKAPPAVEHFRLIAVVESQPQREYEVLRSPIERSMSQIGSYDILADGGRTAPAPMDNPVLAAVSRRIYPRFEWSIFPQLRQQLFDPQNPFAVQVLAAAAGKLEILPGLTFSTQVEASLYDNFKITRISDSVLPHVRTDFLNYFSQGKNGIDNLRGDFRFRITPEVFATVSAGYLESMFAGFGGEILWRPEGARWALGVDLYGLQQRNFDRFLGLQNYRALTGHVALYYASPWYDLNFKLYVGQYLAKDRGMTLEVTRRFRSGVEIGAFVTKTNISAAQFGEGSFDKGIMIRIPLDWQLPINTQKEVAIDLRIVQRDGGQRLKGDATLYEETRRNSYAELQQQ